MSVNNMIGASKTAMEVELALLMCNLAGICRRVEKIKKGKEEGKEEGNEEEWGWNFSLSVLDCCCGSGSLLIAAACQGAAELYGIDIAINDTMVDCLNANFRLQQLYGRRALLINGSVESFLALAKTECWEEGKGRSGDGEGLRVLFDGLLGDSEFSPSSSSSSSSSSPSSSPLQLSFTSRHFDAIVTDIPYDMNVKVGLANKREGGGEGREEAEGGRKGTRGVWGKGRKMREGSKETCIEGDDGLIQTERSRQAVYNITYTLLTLGTYIVLYAHPYNSIHTLFTFIDSLTLCST
jgi:16S rRNA G966 N2-methylase RsmD